MRASAEEGVGCQAIARGDSLAARLRMDLEDAVELLADRFAATDDSCIDLATGDPVLFVTTSTGSATEQARWATRCETLLRLRHRAVAELVDYGVVGAADRPVNFEAWRCGPRWTGARAEAEEAGRFASAFLRACGLAAGPMSGEAVRHFAGGAVILPNAGAGYPLEPTRKQGDDRSLGLEACGFALHPRRAVAALAELFEPPTAMRPRIAVLRGPCGAGKSTAAFELARLARLHGFVPVAARLLGQRGLVETLTGRSVFLIDDESAAGWRALLEMSMQSPRTHALLFLRRHELAAVDDIALERVPVAALRSLIRPPKVPAALERHVQRAAARAEGLPGRFVRLLWPSEISTRPPARLALRGLIAAEHPTEYAIDGQESGTAIHIPADVLKTRAWAAPEELAKLRRDLEAARHLLACGRHAPAERGLRQAIGRLSRRGDWIHAARGALTLASGLLTRGRASDAQRILNQAGKYSRRAEDESSIAEAATLTGIAWIELGRLGEAESVLSGVTTAARSRRAVDVVVRASLALARCAFWQGRFFEAQQLLARFPAGELPCDVAIRAGILDSRVAVGLHELERAVSRALESVEQARALGDAALLAKAAYGAAFAHLAVGDLAAAEHDLLDSLSAARAARDPLRSVRARLLRAEGARRRGRRSEAVALIRRMRALRLPPIVRARVAVLQDLLETSAPADQVLEHHIAATGLNALALFVPFDCRPVRQRHGLHPAVDQMVEILRLCQNAEDERAVLNEVCGKLRTQLRAAALGFMTQDGACTVTIASNGRELEPQLAERAIGAGVPIEPARVGHRIEAAVPVKYGGAAIGALVARWALGRSEDPSGVTAMLTMAATAAAPVVSAALAHRARVAAGGVPELIGMSAALAAVRESIECSARAPFAVLIEGESGSGKELVARALHRRGPRRDRPFSTLNCAALPDDLIEAELFGHARGAFTGAVAERPGIFEEAHGGTLFLDEIGELAHRAQAKLLRVIQEGELRRVGENVSRRVDVRILAATNRDLRADAAAGRFRVDLLYRLDVIRISVPPLRERREDIPSLADHFWREATARIGSRAALAAATLAALARYDWPGNVRELQSVMAALAVRSPKRGVVPPTALPPPLSESPASDTWRLDEARRTFEERFVRAALVRAGGHRTRAASELGISRQGLTKLMSRLGIVSRGVDPL